MVWQLVWHCLLVGSAARPAWHCLLVGSAARLTSKPCHTPVIRSQRCSTPTSNLSNGPTDFMNDVRTLDAKGDRLTIDSIPDRIHRSNKPEDRMAGLVGITAGCAYVSAWASVVIGLIAAIIMIWAVGFVENKLKVDDVVGAVAVDANDYLVYNSGTGALYYDADANGTGLAVQFAMVFASGTTPATLSAAEFVVI